MTVKNRGFRGTFLVVVAALVSLLFALPVLQGCGPKKSGDTEMSADEMDKMKDMMKSGGAAAGANVDDRESGVDEESMKGKMKPGGGE